MSVLHLQSHASPSTLAGFSLQKRIMSVSARAGFPPPGHPLPSSSGGASNPYSATYLFCHLSLAPPGQIYPSKRRGVVDVATAVSIKVEDVTCSGARHEMNWILRCQGLFGDVFRIRN